MNKIITLIILSIILGVNPLFGQTSTINLGIKGGIDYFNYPVENTNSELTFDRKAGFFIGGFGNVKLTDRLSLQPEILLLRHRRNEFFSDLTFRLSGGIPFSQLFKTEMQVTDLIIQIPVTVQYHFTDKFYIETGPQATIIIDKKIEITDETFELEFGNIYEGAELISEIDYDNFDFGFLIGAGYNLSESFGLFTRYNFGLIKRDNQIKSSIFNLGINFKVY